MVDLNADLTAENRGMSADVINKAFWATEKDFLSLVGEQWLYKPQIASVGSCCLVGIVCDGEIFIANAGDSRAVLGRMDEATREIKAVQLSSEHNACRESVRQELRSLHPNDPQIVVMKHQVWRVKGLIQVTTSNVYHKFHFVYLCKIHMHTFNIGVFVCCKLLFLFRFMQSFPPSMFCLILF